MATTTINLGLSLDGLSNVDSSGKATGDVLEWNSVSGNWEAVTPSGGGGGSGVFGISDTAGVYTFYSTLTLAMAAAVAGQTIEMFADVTETGNVQINLKNGVNINFNGHTYTLNNSGTANAFSDNNVAVTCKLMNGIIQRQGGTISEINSCTLYVDSATSVIECEGVKLTSTFGYACINEGTVYGGMYSGVRGFYARTGVVYSATCLGSTQSGLRIVGSRALNCIGISSGSNGIDINTGQMENCHGISIGGGGYGIFAQGGSLLGCTFFSSSSFGAGCISGTTEFYGCTFRSTASAGLYAQAAVIVDNCVGYSTASHGLWAFNAVSIIKNSTGYSTANNGIRAGATVTLHNCTAHSTAAAALHTEGRVYGSNALSTWNNAAGHAITGATTPYTEVFNCHLEVTNAAANCLHYGSAINVKFGANIYKGATTPVNANITQTQANAPDTYGNILIS